MESTSWNVVTWASVDVVVVGAGTAAVSAALECQARGLTVRVLSDLTHLSEDAAGRLDLWTADLDRSDPLVRAIYPTDAVRFPGAMKRAAEQMLLNAKVPYLYGVRPVGVLVDDSGAVSGLLVAARTAVFAIRCATVIDASRFGVVASLANVPTMPRTPTNQKSSWTVLATGTPNWAGEVREVGSPIVLPVDKDKTEKLSAWQLSVDAIPDTAPASFTHLLRAALVDPAVRLCAPTVPQYASSVLSGQTPQSRVESLSDASFSPMPGLLLANGLLPLDNDVLQTLDRADVQARLGRRVARLVQRRSPGSHLHCIQSHRATSGDDRVDQVFTRDDQGRMRIEIPRLPVLDQFDVVVAGGGTGGAPAGIGAARSGAKTLVLETQSGMGGVGTLGLIACYWFGNRVGFTEELDKLVDQTDTIRVNKSRWNPELKMALYHRLLRDAGADAWMRSFAFGVRMNADRVGGLLVSTPWGAGVVEAKAVVDSTGNADIPAAAGRKTRWIGADHVACQGTGLSPLNPLTDYRNSDHNFVDDADPVGVTHAFTNARFKFPDEFDTSPLIDSRERRQIVGDMELSPLDILAERTFPDTLMTASSNFDTHGFTVHPVFFVLSPDKKPLTAHVPMRAMLPSGLDGVIVTGLGASAHRDALPVIRMQADVQNQGFAAGMVAAESAERSCPIRQVDVRSIQRRLIDLKLLSEQIASHVDSFPLSDDVIAAAVEAGATDFKNAAILFAHFNEARPGLIQKLSDPDRAKSEDAALVLGLMGDGAGLDVLLAQLDRQGWDTGWNYRGMGQFGMSSSRLDAAVLAVGRIADPRAVATVKQKIDQLADDSAFSHCRCAAIAAAGLANALGVESSQAKLLASALLSILRLPQMTGHAQVDTALVAANANPDGIETAARNNALREIYLARGLYLCGDIQGTGESILRNYARDLRGQFARHAQTVLSMPLKQSNALDWA